ncbi:spermatogenesis-associated protein 7 isoform X3 [Ascaphus truei]|uniref:spermatogenesis-associated protein 7 isoform X3 n=1 Tax=Ascaphus truei TaxID=8439 RepID=UPI003F5918BF
MGVRGGMERHGGSGVSRAPTVPRYGISSPFKGHLSTKSNAAVDSSVPRSMLRSIKYGDQQRREKMRREVNRFERESSQSPSVSRPNSRERSDYTSPKKGFYEGPCNNIRGSPFSDPGQLYSTNSFISSPRQLEFLENNPELWKGASRRWPESSRIASRSQCEISDSSSVVSIPKSFSRFQDSQQKTYSRDLLDKHSEQFTNKHRPFTPRTLKTEAKSVLAQYRYYTAPRRRRKDEMTEAETQTEDISSFLDEVTASEKRESPWLREKDGDAGDAQLVNDSEDINQTDWHKLTTHHSFARVSSSNELKSPSPIMQKIKSEEEELVYLTFITDVTNEILALGLFSNRVLERVFERHFEENKLRLDEGKMCHLLDMLRKDLGCKVESNEKYNGNCNQFKAFVQDHSGTKKHPRNSHTLDTVGNGISQVQNVSYDYERIADCQLYDGILQETSEQTTDLDNLTGGLEDDQSGSSLDALNPRFNSSESDDDTEKTDKLKDLDELEQSFSEMVQVSKEEECSGPDNTAGSPAPADAGVAEAQSDRLQAICEIKVE